MPNGYRVSGNEFPYFVTFTVIGWADVFSREIYKELLLEDFNYCIKNKGLILHAWVIMTNHLHLIVNSKNNNLPGIIRDLKSYTSKRITDCIIKNNKESKKDWLINLFKEAGKKNSDNSIFQFWKQNYHPIELSYPFILNQRMNYLHNNPVKAGLVWEPWNFKYSSAIDYYTNEKGLLEIKRL